MAGTASWECEVCGYVYAEADEDVAWGDLPEDWECPVCGAGREEFEAVAAAAPDVAEAPAEPAPTESASDELAPWRRTSDEREGHMAAIHRMAATGEPIVEPMRTAVGRRYWDEILILGAQLARRPLDESEAVATRTVIGPNADQPLVIDTPVTISHMSFGALSREAKLALAKGSAAAGTAMCSGEGGILPESMAAAHRYVFEIVPNGYSITDDNLAAVDAVEIKVGQSAKPGMGGHLPGTKVTEEIAHVRGRPVGQSITSPASFSDLRNADGLRRKVDGLREKTGGRPVGIKLAAGDIEADLELALAAGPDFVTIDGRPGATAAAPRQVKAATSVPTVFALHRARRYLDGAGAAGVSLVVTGGFRVSADIVKALAMGADAVAVASAGMIACGCQQYRVCHTGRCPVGVATQDPELRARLDVDLAATRVANYLRATTEELRAFTRLTGRADVHGLSVGDLCTVDSEISGHTDIRHA